MVQAATLSLMGLVNFGVDDETYRDGHEHPNEEGHTSTTYWDNPPGMRGHVFGTANGKTKDENGLGGYALGRHLTDDS